MAGEHPDLPRVPPAVDLEPAILVRVFLFGPLRIEDPRGGNLTPASRRAQALLAMLCLAPRGQRSRVWLRDKLWSDRDETQGSASLRQELLTIRKALGPIAEEVLLADRLTVALALPRVEIVAERRRDGSAEEFLEGIDIADEEFEEWLRQERQARLDKLGAAEPSRRQDNRCMVAAPVALEFPAQEPRERWRVLLTPPFGVGQTGAPALAAAAVMGALRAGLIETGDLEVLEPQGGLPPGGADPSTGASLVLQPHLAWDDTRTAVRLALRVPASGALVWSGQCVAAVDALINGEGDDLFGLVARAIDETIGYFLRVGRERALAENRLAAAISLIFQLDRRHLDRAELMLRARLGGEFGTAETFAWLAFLMTFRVGQRFNADDRPVLEEAQMFARKALETGRGSALVNALVGHVHSYLFGEYDLATDYFAQSLRLQPENLMALDLNAALHVYTGRAKQALTMARRAQAIGRFSPNRFYFETTVGLASAFAGDHRTALATSQAALLMRPDFNSLLRIAVASTGHLGDHERAHALYTKLLRTEPAFSISYLRDIKYPGLDTEAGRNFLDGLRRAGVK